MENVAEREGARTATAVLAGLAAAIAGAVVWGLIVRWSEYEVGFVAWGIGFVVGTAVVMGARNRRSLPLQVAAVVLALAGVVLGKYLAFVWSVNAGAEDAGIGVSLPLFSADTFELFADRESGVWSWFDLLWIGLAAYTAFRIPQPDGAEGAPAVAGTPESSRE